ETEYLARDTPAGLGFLHRLSYQLRAKSGVEFSHVPPSAKLYFGHDFQLRAFKFGVTNGFQRERFEAVLDAKARFRHTCEMHSERSECTTSGAEPWRKWFALASQANPQILQTLLRNIRPEMKATFDQTFGGTILSAKLELFPVPLRLFLDESGELIRVDQLPGTSQIVANAPAREL
ncbi:MAG: hypothetical protein AAGH89_10500, partial [Verrucomicrobiota bacterium]